MEVEFQSMFTYPAAMWQTCISKLRFDEQHEYKKNESVLKLKDEQKYRDGKSYNGILSFPVFDEVTLLKLLFLLQFSKNYWFEDTDGRLLTS